MKPEVQTPPSEVGAEAGATQTLQVEYDTVAMTVPLMPPVAGEYAQRHIDLDLTTERADTLKRIMDGLIATGQKKADGRPVASAADAIRWMLDGIHAANVAASEEQPAA